MRALVQEAHIVHSSLRSRWSLGLSYVSDTTLSLFFNFLWYLSSYENFTQSLEKKSFPDLYFCLVFVWLFGPVLWSSGWGWSDCATWNLVLPPASTSPTPGLQACIITPGLTSLFLAPPLPPLAPTLPSLGAYILFTVFLRTFAFHTRPYLSSLCLSGSFFSITQRIINHAKGTKMGFETV